MKNPLSYGFVPGSDRGVKNAALQACSLRDEKPWVFKTDISKFFDKIPRATLKSKLRSLINKRSLYPLLDAAIDCEVVPRTKGETKKLLGAGIKAGQGVRQGMPLSPFFANLFLYEFDKLILRKRISMVRYADDLIFFANSERETEDIFHLVRRELKAIGLEIPDISAKDKTQIYSPSDDAEFLGVGLISRNEKYYPIVTESQFMKMRESYLLISNIDELVRRGYDVAQFNSALLAKRNGYFSAYDFCANARDLVGKLNDWELSVRTKVYKELGIELRKLTSSQRVFLGIDALPIKMTK